MCRPQRGFEFALLSRSKSPCYCASRGFKGIDTALTFSRFGVYDVLLENICLCAVFQSNNAKIVIIFYNWQVGLQRWWCLLLLLLLLLGMGELWGWRKKINLPLAQKDVKTSRIVISIHVIKQSPPPRLSVCPLAINSKTTARIFIRFSPIDRVILPENTGI